MASPFSFPLPPILCTFPPKMFTPPPPIQYTRAEIEERLAARNIAASADTTNKARPQEARTVNSSGSSAKQKSRSFDFTFRRRHRYFRGSQSTASSLPTSFSPPSPTRFPETKPTLGGSDHNDKSAVAEHLSNTSSSSPIEEVASTHSSESPKPVGGKIIRLPEGFGEHPRPAPFPPTKAKLAVQSKPLPPAPVAQTPPVRSKAQSPTGKTPTAFALAIEPHSCPQIPLPPLPELGETPPAIIHTSSRRLDVRLGKVAKSKAPECESDKSVHGQAQHRTRLEIDRETETATILTTAKTENSAASLSAALLHLSDVLRSHALEISGSNLLNASETSSDSSPHGSGKAGANEALKGKLLAKMIQVDNLLRNPTAVDQSLENGISDRDKTLSARMGNSAIHLQGSTSSICEPHLTKWPKIRRMSRRVRRPLLINSGKAHMARRSSKRSCQSNQAFRGAGGNAANSGSKSRAMIDRPTRCSSNVSRDNSTETRSGPHPVALSLELNRPYRLLLDEVGALPTPDRITVPRYHDECGSTGIVDPDIGSRTGSTATMVPIRREPNEAATCASATPSHRDSEDDADADEICSFFLDFDYAAVGAGSASVPSDHRRAESDRDLAIRQVIASPTLPEQQVSAHDDEVHEVFDIEIHSPRSPRNTVAPTPVGEQGFEWDDDMDIGPSQSSTTARIKQHIQSMRIRRRLSG